jgi:hypothetical protein
MSDTTYQTFQHYGTNAERLAFTPNPASGIKPIYIWYETDTGNVFLYHTAWVPISGSGAPVGAHATTHEPGGSDAMAVDAIPATGSLRTLGTGSNQATAGNDARLSDARTPLPHAASHAAGGSDPLPIVRKQITLVVDNGTLPLTTGYKAWISMPVAGTLMKWRLLADVVGSVVIDVWKDVFANYPPTVADTITAAAKPTLSSALSAESSTLTGWTTTFNAGDIFAFNVDSVATIKKLSLTLEFE